MLRNYLTIALRNLFRHKVYAIINLVGLAIGMTCVILLVLYAWDEWHYDRHFQRVGNIYRVVQAAKWEGGSLQAAVLPPSFATYLQKDFPEIERTVRVMPADRPFVRLKDDFIQTNGVFYADSTLFKVFDYRFLAGDPNTALHQPHSIVLTRSLAKKIFGSESLAMNRTVSFRGQQDCLVTGVMDDVPVNTHFRFTGLISLNSLGMAPSAQLSLSGDLDEQCYTYLLLRKGSRVDRLEAKLPSFIAKYLSADLKSGMSLQLRLQPIPFIHLYSHLEAEMSANGDINYVYALLSTAFLILIIASINYMNLATARSSRRAKEVGIRKVVGSRRSQLIGQFLTESVVLALMAFIVGLLGAGLLLPFFNQLTGKQLTMDALFESSIGWWLVVIAIFCGLISGSYPALLLSGFKASTVLKGSWINVAQGVTLRKGLVVFQFAASIILIAATWVVYQQLRYVNTKQLGFDKEQVVTLRVNSETRGKLAELEIQLLRNSRILGVTAASNPLGIDENVSKGPFFFETNNRVMATQSQFTQRLSVDYDFLDVMRIRLKEGRNFLPTMATDAQRAVLVNEALVKSLGWQQAVGKRVAYLADDAGNKAEAVVIGVVKDFHPVSLHHVIEPMVFSLIPPQEADNLFVRISPASIPSTLGYLKQTYRAFDSDHPFEAHFLDDNFARQYETDTKQARILMTFSVLATLIACLGLFGLAAFTAEQRTKEIGIRKVLGASVNDIVTMLSKDFVKLVLWANVMAWPLAYYALNRWLQDFAYRIEIGWWVFVLAGSAALLIALLTVSYQALKAAIANPVKSLRTE